MFARAALLTLAGFLSGSSMFALWLGRSAGKDVRLQGDGNPGAVNAFRAGGWRLGVPVLLLDFLKGAVPVALARYVLGVTGFWLVPVALAPVAGHAFSPWLGFRGGKAVAVTFGVWCGLTLWEGPTVFGALLGFVGLFQENDGWTVVFAAVGLLAYWFARGAAPVLAAVWFGTALILAVKHRQELGRGPVLRRWIQIGRRRRA